jgi:hypothetical protein
MKISRPGKVRSGQIAGIRSSMSTETTRLRMSLEKLSRSERRDVEGTPLDVLCLGESTTWLLTGKEVEEVHTRHVHL